MEDLSASIEQMSRDDIITEIYMFFSRRKTYVYGTFDICRIINLLQTISDNDLEIFSLMRGYYLTHKINCLYSSLRMLERVATPNEIKFYIRGAGDGSDEEDNGLPPSDIDMKLYHISCEAYKKLREFLFYPTIEKVKEAQLALCVLQLLDCNINKIQEHVSIVIDTIWRSFDWEISGE